jgi:hypothetical protein
VSRAQSQVEKLHELLMARWEAYRTRRVRLLAASGTGGLPAALRRDARAMGVARLNAIRDLMRMEMPDRKSDVIDGPTQHVLQYLVRSPTGPAPAPTTFTVTIAQPTLWLEYRRRANANSGGNLNVWTTTHQGAECLYLIVASVRDITGTGLDFLQEGEIGDVDEDGMKEILDPWGNPIEFLRWAPGYMVSPGVDGQWGDALDDDDNNGETNDFWEAWDYTSVPGQWIPGGYGDDRAMITPMQLVQAEITASGITAEPPDPFNPLRIDPKQFDPNYPDYPRNFTLYPLIFSAGPDGLYDINVLGTDPATGNEFRYANTVPPNNPFEVPSDNFPAGVPLDSNQDGELSFMDNITNHAIETR